MFSFIDHPTSNVNARALPVSMLVLHYTGMESGAAALNRMCDPAAKVSAHYMVEEDGRIFRLAEEGVRAWHAGVSFWRGITDVNSASIGIEIVNGGADFGLPAFPDAQIRAVLELCTDILSRHEIAPSGVVGHSDIAPGRKADPGPRFPWARLAAAGVGVWPGDGNGDRKRLCGPGENHPRLDGVKRDLAAIGYGLEADECYCERTQAVLEAFQMRFRPDVHDGVLDAETADLIARVRALCA